MLLLSKRKASIAILRNLSSRLGLTQIVKRVLRRPLQGGTPWVDAPVEEQVAHILEIFHLLRRHLGTIRGKVGLEIGPGDNSGVAYCLLNAGAARVYLIEKHASVQFDTRAQEVLLHLDEGLGETLNINATPPGPEDVPFMFHKIHLVQQEFETMTLNDTVDFIISNDVLEHVRDVAPVFRKAYELLSAGGVFANSIDLAGHNAFRNHGRPLDFLTCGDRLWNLMFSHVATTNRTRYPEFIRIARDAGFHITVDTALRRADAAYVESIRPHLLPRYRTLSCEHLSVTQLLLVAQKPTG